jgi:hypothetical protein
MSATRQSTAELVKPLVELGAIVLRFTAGATIAAGEIVGMSSDGYLDPSDSTSAADEAIGIAVTAAVEGGTLDVCVFGPIECMTAATPGATVFNSSTAGEPSETSGGNDTAIGWAMSATRLFVNPEHLA